MNNHRLICCILSFLQGIWRITMYTSHPGLCRAGSVAICGAFSHTLLRHACGLSSQSGAIMVSIIKTLLFPSWFFSKKNLRELCIRKIIFLWNGLMVFDNNNLDIYILDSQNLVIENLANLLWNWLNCWKWLCENVQAVPKKFIPIFKWKLLITWK